MRANASFYKLVHRMDSNVSAESVYVHICVCVCMRANASFYKLVHQMDLNVNAESEWRTLLLPFRM